VPAPGAVSVVSPVSLAALASRPVAPFGAVRARAARLDDRGGGARADSERRQEHREEDRAVRRRPCESMRPMLRPGCVSEYLVGRVHAALSAASPYWLREAAGESLRTRTRRAAKDAKTAKDFESRTRPTWPPNPKNLASLASLVALPSLSRRVPRLSRPGAGPQAAARLVATTNNHARSSISASFSRVGTAAVPSTPRTRCDA
jgi:hypothetical protein